MATSYNDIYDRFLSKITDYELADLLDEEITVELNKFMRSAIVDFKYAESDRLVRNDESKEFANDLTELEQEIISKFMIVHWLNPQILRLENVRNELGNKDFKLYSPANFLDKIRVLKRELKDEANNDMIYYLYN